MVSRKASTLHAAQRKGHFRGAKSSQIPFSVHKPWALPKAGLRPQSWSPEGYATLFNHLQYISISILTKENGYQAVGVQATCVSGRPSQGYTPGQDYHHHPVCSFPATCTNPMMSCSILEHFQQREGWVGQMSPAWLASVLRSLPPLVAASVGEQQWQLCCLPGPCDTHTPGGPIRPATDLCFPFLSSSKVGL